MTPSEIAARAKRVPEAQLKTVIEYLNTLPKSHGLNMALQDRFRGCLVGLAVGDALGGRFEAQSADYIRSRIPTVEQLIHCSETELWYTDDTQMAIGVAESLADYGEIVEKLLFETFVANYTPSRGYGRGARAVLDAMEGGQDYQSVAAKYFPGGSFGNGAAMRVAPVGLFFRRDPRMVLAQSRLSALLTHVHPLGIEGAQLLALAVAHVSSVEQFNRDAFFAELLQHCHSPEYRGKLESAAQTQTPSDLRSLGNGIEALESVPTAIASFALTPHSYQDTIGNVIFLGGDTDTLACMAGSLSGAFLGMDGIPKALVNSLEDSPKGRSYLIDLANRLHQAHECRNAATTRDA